MLKFHRGITLERLDKFTSRDSFNDVNLHSCLIKHQTAEAVRLEAYEVPDLKRIPFEEAVKGPFSKTEVGKNFGPTWATVWFKVRIEVPSTWKNEVVQFRWDSDSEAMVWSTDGKPLQGLTGGNGWDRRHEFQLTDKSKGGEAFELYVEMACNGMFGAGNNGLINPPVPDRRFTLKTADIVVPNLKAVELLYDFDIISNMARELPADSQAGSEALVTANAIVNAFHPKNVATWDAALAIAKNFLSKPSAETHQVMAIGHCHIDTAWLWPYDETKRKCARSWATQVELMNRFPEFKFACSQAQQYEWVETLYPNLFEEIKVKVKSGQFIPIGGTWVEMDCNIPSGESFVRQFLYGQRYFEKHFGKRHDVFWLPDTFGYAAQLPQIVKLSGAKYFLTQKLSWNNINKFPHTTFNWVGLDGTKVLTHFPPADTYNAQASVKEVLYGVKNHKDKFKHASGMLVVGHGDGGGGPTPEMLLRAQRMKNVQGLPKVTWGNPNDFFKKLEDDKIDFVEWVGELYFELHRGTYTSQALNKKYNRYSEFLLRDVEFLSTLGLVGGQQYPKEEIDRLWKLVCLNQFHDVLPGSSIEMVYMDSTKMYKDVEKCGTSLKQQALQFLLKGLASGTSVGGKQEKLKYSVQENIELFDACCGFYGVVARKMLDRFLKTPLSVATVNTLQYPRSELVEVEMEEGVKAKDLSFAQTTWDGKGLALVNVPGFGVSVNNLKHTSAGSLSVNSAANGFVLENETVKATVDQYGRLTGYFDKKNNREVLETGKVGNLFKIFEDIPIFWDGWDVEVYHLEKGWEVQYTGKSKVVESGPLRVAVQFEHQISETSTLKQTITLSVDSPRLDFHTDVKWNENRRFLKVEFPFNIHSDFATYETAYGWVQRPTHFNTSWDLAKFEVCAHKWADFSEYGYGVALLNDCKYGYATHRNVMRLSLLRAPKAPDAHCDIGTHTFKYALYPHKGTFTESDVVQQGLQFNVPLISRLIPRPEDMPEKSIVVNDGIFKLDAPNVVLDCVKKAEDSNDIIVRMYEAYGGRVSTTLSTSLPIKSAQIVNTVEDTLQTVPVQNKSVPVSLTPFQILTLKLSL